MKTLCEIIIRKLRSREYQKSFKKLKENMILKKIGNKMKLLKKDIQF